MKEPNLFIVGAPKCGTTTLAGWLRDHPQVYVPPLKEPFYFNTDHGHRAITTWNKYQAPFEGAGEEHIAICDASVFYLYSQVAGQNIELRYREPRFVVAIRNPASMAPSLHEQLLFTGDEHIRNFEKAWRLSPQRLQGGGVTRTCREPTILAYQSICLLGAQLQRLLDTVPAGRVHVVVLDDVKGNPRAEYCKVLQFLGINDDGRTDFAVKNQAKERLWPSLGRATNILQRVRGKLAIPPLGINVISRLDAFNKRERPRRALPLSLERELRAFFTEDVRLLEILLDRDLSHWTN